MIAPTPTRLKDPNGYTRYGHGDAEGYFFLYLPRGGGVQNTFHCREELAVDWDEDHPRCRYLGFMWNSQIMVRRTERMWTDLETKMGVTEHTVFHRVLESDDDDEAIEKTQVLLYLSPFWVKSQTHRSVCSLLLRLLIVHYTDSLTKAIQSYSLARHCAAALNHFLAGNTKPLFADWSDEYEQAVTVYEKAHAKWEKACAAIDRKSDEDAEYPDEPEYPHDRTDDGYGFVAMYADRSTEEIKRLLTKP